MEAAAAARKKKEEEEVCVFIYIYIEQHPGLPCISPEYRLVEELRSLFEVDHQQDGGCDEGNRDENTPDFRAIFLLNCVGENYKERR